MDLVIKYGYEGSTSYWSNEIYYKAILIEHKKEEYK